VHYRKRADIGSRPRTNASDLPWFVPGHYRKRFEIVRVRAHYRKRSAFNSSAVSKNYTAHMMLSARCKLSAFPFGEVECCAACVKAVFCSRDVAKFARYFIYYTQ